MDGRQRSSGAAAQPFDPAALPPWEGPAILLVDLDAFFASVEQLDHPAWRGKPVVVAGDPDKHGVVSTASYEARVFGVHSGMSAAAAHRACPDAFWTRGRFGRYREVSGQVMAILRDETPHVQQVSIDEAFLDVTPTPVNREHPAGVAARIQRRVEELGVSCSVGVATTKAVAKIASEQDKPRGLTVVYPGGERAFLDPLPTRALSGVGPAAQERLRRAGIETLGQLARADEGTVEQLLGKVGIMAQRRARGLDEPVAPERSAKSVSSETTFARDLTRRADVEAAIASQAAKVGRRLRMKGLAGRVCTLRVKFDDLRVRSVQRQLAKPCDDELVLTPLLCRMLDEVWAEGVPLRLVGVAVGGFEDAGGAVQQALFDVDSEAPSDQDAPALIADARRRRGLLEASDRVKERFGEGAVMTGGELRLRTNNTGSAPKNPADYA